MCAEDRQRWEGKTARRRYAVVSTLWKQCGGSNAAGASQTNNNSPERQDEDGDDKVTWQWRQRNSGGNDATRQRNEKMHAAMGSRATGPAIKSKAGVRKIKWGIHKFLKVKKNWDWTFSFLKKRKWEILFFLR